MTVMGGMPLRAETSHATPPSSRLCGLLAVAGAALALTTGEALAQGETQLWPSPYYLFLLVLGAVIAIPQGVWYIVSGHNARRRARASLSWPTAKGHVVASEVIRSRSFWTRFALSRHIPRVRYEYTVNGSRHSGEVIRFGLGALWQAPDAEAIVAAYPVGAEVDVHYDPARPKTAALETSDAAATGRVRQGWLTLPLMLAPALIMYGYHELLGG